MFSGPGGDVVAVGRGGMRGRRRVNESECLLTKPSGCNSKQGKDIKSFYLAKFHKSLSIT